jgi:hypothetical protein
MGPIEAVLRPVFGGDANGRASDRVPAAAPAPAWQAPASGLGRRLAADRQVEWNATAAAARCISLGLGRCFRGNAVRVPVAQYAFVPRTGPTPQTITDFRHFDRVRENREAVMKAEAASEMIYSWYSEKARTQK